MKGGNIKDLWYKMRNLAILLAKASACSVTSPASAQNSTKSPGPISLRPISLPRYSTKLQLSADAYRASVMVPKFVTFDVTSFGS